MYDKLVAKVNTNDTKVPSIRKLVSKKRDMIQKNKILKKQLKMLLKRYLILVGCLKRQHKSCRNWK